MNTNSKIYSLRSSTKGNLFVPRPNSNFMKRTFHYSRTILWNYLPPNLKLIQNIDLLKQKYTDYLMSKQNNEWSWHYIHCTHIVKFCCEDVYILFEIVFVVFNYYCFEGHMEN
jgi:hypothetical protein